MARVLAERIPDHIWNSHKLAIGELYIGEDRKLCGPGGVMDIMKRRHGFSPTKSQYENKTAFWGMRKKITDKEWNAILPRVQEREERGRQTHVMFNGLCLDEKRIGRELDRRRSNSNMHQGFVQVADPGTPPGFSIQSPPNIADTHEDEIMMDPSVPSLDAVSDSLTQKPTSQVTAMDTRPLPSGPSRACAQNIPKQTKRSSARLSNTRYHEPYWLWICCACNSA